MLRTPSLCSSESSLFIVTLLKGFVSLSFSGLIIGILDGGLCRLPTNTQEIQHIYKLCMFWAYMSYIGHSLKGKLTFCALWCQRRWGRRPIAPQFPWPPQTPPATPPLAASRERPVLGWFPRTPASGHPIGRHRWFWLEITWDQY